MKTFLFSSLTLLLIHQIGSAQNPDDFAAKCAELGQAAQNAGNLSVEGDGEGWFFLTQELLHCGKGAFWKKDWQEIAANGQDPVPYLVDFRKRLEAKGIDLLLIPVPAKAVIYPDKLSSNFQPGDPVSAHPFYDRLESAGIPVLDLEPAFHAQRKAGHQIYCAGDAHFSPYACQVISQVIKERIAAMDWYASHPKQPIERGPRTELKIVGDLVPEDKRQRGSEILTVQYCGIPEGQALAPVAPDPGSPVLLLGDSHTLIFNEGDSRGMHCTRAGLIDQLQADLGFALDQVGVRGSGSRAARVQLYRHATAIPDYWANKKLAIWCFSVREFTQSFDKLIEVPIEKE